jgi:flagellar basal-body rod protein FlgB
MIKDLAILRQAGALARHASARHAVIAENISNSDTPGYKAKDIPAFDAEAAKAAKSGDADLERRYLQPQILKGLESAPNGNTVNLEDQMLRAADTQSQHTAATTIYRKVIELTRLSVSTR